MDQYRTQYEKLYEDEAYYWGTQPAEFLDKLIELKGPRPGMKIFDIGCGEGKDAVYMAKKGYTVTAFDLAESGIRKTQKLAAERKAKISAYVDDINTFETDEHFDIIYSTGTLQYLKEENIEGFFKKIHYLTNPRGLNYFSVFVEKPYLQLPPDMDREEKLWKGAQLFSWYADWKIHYIDEVIFECSSGGTPHTHCMDIILAEKIPLKSWF